MKWSKQSVMGGAALVALAACTNEPSSISRAPTSPLVNQEQGQFHLRCADPILLINSLFPFKQREGVFLDYALIVVAYQRGDTTAARSLAAKLYNFTLQEYNNCVLINAGTPAGAQAVATFIDAVFCTIGMTVNLSVNLNDNVVAIVPPNTDTIIRTGTSNAGVQLFAAQQLPQELVVITRLADNASSPGCPQYSGPLCTPLAQFPPFYDYSLTPAPQLGASAPPFIVEECVDTTQVHVPTSQLYIAHNVTSDSAQVLPKATTSLGLACDGVSTGMGPQHNVFELARNGQFLNAAKELGSRLSDFMVKDAYALTGRGITGMPTSFSPFGIVDVNDFVAYQNGGYTYHAPPAFPNPPAPGWGDISGFEQPSFVPDATWIVNTSAYGNSPFGSGNNGFGCPLSQLPNLNQVWPSFNPVPPSTGNLNNDPSTIFLLRKSFYVPASWTTDLYVGIAVDNDVEVFVNGTPVTPTSGGVPVFATHEGCAQQDEFVFDVPNSQLVLGGQNLLAIRARDRGGESYIDSRLSPPTPLTPTTPSTPPAP
jgi:hypothetical protein